MCFSSKCFIINVKYGKAYFFLNLIQSTQTQEIIDKQLSVTTLQVRVKTTRIQMLQTNSELQSWEIFSEDVSSLDDQTAITDVNGLLDQLNMTRDSSDYLWYTTRWSSTSWSLLLWVENEIWLLFVSTLNQLHCLILQCWNRLIRIIVTWRPTSHSHSSVCWRCYTCLCQWTVFRYICERRSHSKYNLRRK